jgi:hypothetical protein
MKIDYLPFSEWRNESSSATISMIEIIGTYENTFKLSITVKCLFRRAYINKAGHDAK